ncbi:phospholipase A2-like [Contarinia nasturtii]|uniref:phospholipase A2-like n=1 Tax=Contarinia nasturtii TaxID=265458 RepID=UPI0012D3E667|nr:phospholipase A2-like [Contarinia nasturtii]
MSVKLGTVLLCLSCVSHFEAKLTMTPREIENSLEDNSDESKGSQRINLSVPGTKWCGPGNTAASYDDLGRHKEVDMCCRDHDHCDNIAAGETKYNLTNRDYFTVLDCDCDHQFHQCLKKINSKESNRIGRMYFTLRNHCYHDDKPIVRCDGYDTEVFLHRCIHYVFDDSQPKRYQWFDLPLYYDKNERDSVDDEMYDF